MLGKQVAISAIQVADVERVATFLNARLNESVTVDAWIQAMRPPWRTESPNHGFLLSSEGTIVGACLAIYSEREIDGRPERFCNLGALCVDEDFRGHTFLLVRAVLGQRGFHFTDLSPSGNVVELNERLGFKHLDTTTALVANLPRLTSRGVLVTRHDRIAKLLTGDDLRIFTDHREAAAAIHVVIRDGAELCYVILRRDRRKGLPLFASILHVSDRAVFARASRALFGHLLLRHGVVATLAELRVVGDRPPHSSLLSQPRRKMFRSRTLPASSIDYLYSELTCLAW